MDRFAGMRKRLTYANVMATIAVFVALGGGAYAAATIGPGDIKKNAVRAKHIKANSVTPAKLKKAPLWARVQANGAISAQSGGISVISELGGVFQLDMGRNVGKAALLVTPLDSDGIIDGTAGGAICSHTNQCTGAADGANNAVRIYTSNVAGNATALPFYVAIIR